MTTAALRPVAVELDFLIHDAERLQVLDRYGNALNSTYANRWNVFEQVPLHAVPETLAAALILAEDQRFFHHRGQDWLARWHAVWQNVIAGRAVRGASTITEQVVRMINPRPRTLWSRWLEGWEARLLESELSKQQILEFYINQVPYAARRRGMLQAARYYFDRDLHTLSVAEMLALAVLVRAPSRLDLSGSGQEALSAGMVRLAERMVAMGALQKNQAAALSSTVLTVRRPALAVNAGHFLRFARSQKSGTQAVLRTTLDAVLQRQLQDLLDQRLRQLSHLRLRNAALLLVDHRQGEVLAWVVAGEDDPTVPGRAIDAVLARRQPGSALKPLLYALALERGWTAATLIDDSPYAVTLGGGLHEYQNYSRRFHGPVTLRAALGNSLNIPAIKALQFVGVSHYHARLQRLGLRSLKHGADYYGEGLALGNGEVSLLELVQAYAALANRGRFRALSTQQGVAATVAVEPIYSAEVASLIGNILSDPGARKLEFGSASLLNFPIQTAVKTGTSSDYRDSWALGYDARFVAGIWMGNLDQTATYGVTGSTGPALALRATFAILHGRGQTRPLWLSPRLQRHVLCADATSDAQSAPLRQRIEYFLPGTAAPAKDSVIEYHSLTAVQCQPAFAPLGAAGEVVRLVQPAQGLQLALDPRLSLASQAFEFMLDGVREDDVVQWRVDNQLVDRHKGGRYRWPLVRGHHTVSAAVWRDGLLIARTGARQFTVK